MRLHALQGDRVNALRVYHTCATLLQRELSVEPSEPTRRIYEQLLNLEKPPEHRPTQSTHSPTRDSLVGRQPEWQKLLSAWRMAASGHPHLFVIAGEAGIGKTSLAEELFDWVSRQGLPAVRTRAYAAEGALAYHRRGSASKGGFQIVIEGLHLHLKQADFLAQWHFTVCAIFDAAPTRTYARPHALNRRW